MRRSYIPALVVSVLLHLGLLALILFTWNDKELKVGDNAVEVTLVSSNATAPTPAPAPEPVPTPPAPQAEPQPAPPPPPPPTPAPKPTPKPPVAKPNSKASNASSNFSLDNLDKILKATPTKASTQ